MKKRRYLVVVTVGGASVGLILFLLLMTMNAPVQIVTAASSNTVAITENGFNPSVLTVEVGTTVVWTNQTQETVHLRSGEPYRIYLPLVLRNIGGVKITVASSKVVPVPVTRYQNNWVDDDLAPGQSCTYTFTVVGDYPLFLTNHPDKTGVVKVVEPVPDFTLDVLPNSQTVAQGQSSIFSVALSATNGFSSPVTLFVTGLPTGATSAWGNNPVTPTDGTILTITTSLDTPTGTHSLTVSGNGGGQSHNSQVSLVIEPPPPSPLFETVLSVTTEGGYANAPDNASLDLGTGDGEDFTVETFFYISDLSYDNTVIDLLVRKDQSYSLYISFNSGSPDWVSFKLWTGAGAEVTLSYLSNLSLGWHHVAAVFDNEFLEDEDLMAIYLDGSRVANSDDENIHVDWTPGIPNSSSELLVGGVPFGAAGFNGLIEEVRFSDIVRYSDTLYSVPTIPFSNDTNTRALWHFDETAGSTIFSDDSNNNNTLTGHGAQTYNP